MLGKLSSEQIEALLTDQVTGRIGCHADGVTYIVPVNFVYDGTEILMHSAKGMKIDMMEKNPEVCFQVDAIQDLANWESVITWGRYEEITDIFGKTRAMQKIINKVMPLMPHENSVPSHGFSENESDIGTTQELIIYKIVLTKKTGCFEKDN